MKYLNRSFTMPVCAKTMSELDYDFAVGKITKEEFDRQGEALSGKVAEANSPTAA